MFSNVAPMGTTFLGDRGSGSPQHSQALGHVIGQPRSPQNLKTTMPQASSSKIHLDVQFRKKHVGGKSVPVTVAQLLGIF